MLYHVSTSRRAQNAWLLLASCVFYGWWDWRFCGLMLGAATVDYFLALRMDPQAPQGNRRWWLVASLVGNLGLLGFFKYFNFFAESLVLAAAGVGIEIDSVTLQVVLPVGISFYTFQTLSYTLDVYRGKMRASRDFIAYLSFVCFFPQLVAGPIERATHLLPQFLKNRVFCATAAREGCRFILWGLAKKLLLADQLGLVVESAYSSPQQMSAAVLMVATFSFAFQIYLDFSAYSDIAIGSARLFGIELSRNFAYPYFSQSISEFWRRWHISLSTWFRDYVFIPLGGSRQGMANTLRNLILTTFLSGLWHGAAWHFVLWGLLHGLYLSAERFFRRIDVPLDDPGDGKTMPSITVLLRMIRTFTLTYFAWILFRASSLSDAVHICGKIVRGPFSMSFYPDLGSSLQVNGPVLMGVLVLVLWEWLARRRWLPLSFEGLPLPARWFGYSLLFWGIVLGGPRKVAEFIYFQF